MDLTSKTVLNFAEACEYAGFKPSYMYQLTSTGRIKHYKPCGKMIFFRREELEEFLTRKDEKKNLRKH